MLPERHVRDWILETLAWLLGELRARLPLPRPLLLPNDAYFPVPRDLEPRRRAAALFACLHRHAGVRGLRCRLRCQRSSEPVSGPRPWIFVAASPEPAAIFVRSLDPAGRHTIEVHPELLDDPERLVAILSHALAHALLARSAGPPPGGENAWDAATDLCAVLLGAGVFLANSALRVCREENYLWEGLSIRCQGWLGPGDFAFALAVFLRLFALPPDAAEPYLRRGSRAELARARRLLRAAEYRRALERLEAAVIR
jgi:hypothetical protein